MINTADGPANQQDLYEILQVNQSADSLTIERVFRHLAKRFHPDNQETGDPERFGSLVEAFRVLSDPEERANYDARYDRVHTRQWEVLDQESAGDDVEADRRIRLGILSLLYAARRQDVRSPGIGIYELEQMLNCPEHHMQFHVWYLKENGWIQRLENGLFAITVGGVDKLVESELPWRRPGQGLLPKGAETQDEQPQSNGNHDAVSNGSKSGVELEEELAAKEA